MQSIHFNEKKYKSWLRSEKRPYFGSKEAMEGYLQGSKFIRTFILRKANQPIRRLEKDWLDFSQRIRE